jgi:DNA repair protein SbcD/Mre11
VDARDVTWGVRLVHLSDLHLGYRQYQRQTPAGINQREADVAAVFRNVIERVIALKPDVVLLAGDIFHNVRPPNPAILHAFQQLSRLTEALPEAIVIMIAGDHDTPRSRETVCILRLFERVGVHVVDTNPKRLLFPERQLAVLAVPETLSLPGELKPEEGFRYNILMLHGRVPELMSEEDALTDRASVNIEAARLNAPLWNYVALGHYHVFARLRDNVFYSGSMEYTSARLWVDLSREKARKPPGKVFVEFDLDSGRWTTHRIAPARPLEDLPPINARGLSAEEVDAVIAGNVAAVRGGIEDRIVRQVVHQIPRHIARELDQRALREYRRRALHFQLDTRRPDPFRTEHASGAPGRRPSLLELVREKLRGRPLTSDLDREQFVALGLKYLQEVEERERELTPTAAGQPEEP